MMLGGLFVARFGLGRQAAPGPAARERHDVERRHRLHLAREHLADDDRHPDLDFDHAGRRGSRADGALACSSYEKQGRVFGLAQAVEVAASPISAFVVGPVAQFAIPYMATPEGRAAWGWLLGDGQARGIAAVFVVAGVVGLAATLLALASRPYRTLSDAYTAAPADGATQ